MLFYARNQSLGNNMESDTPNLAARTFDRMAYGGILFLVFVLPLALFYSPYGVIQSEFKVAILHTVTAFVLASWFASLLLRRKMLVIATKVGLLLLAFFAVVIITTITSISPILSVVGRHSRYEGLIVLVDYGLLFFVATQTFCQFSRVRMLVISIVTSAGLVAVYGWFQYAGLDFLGTVLAPPRVNSTLGNPVHLGGYLAIVLLLVIALLLASTDSYTTILWGVLSFVIFACLIATFSRGGWVSFVFSLAVFSVLNYRCIVRWKWKVVGIAVLFLLMGAALWIQSPQTELPHSIVSERVASVVRGGTTTFGSRLEYWKAAVGMISEHPLTGFGPETFRLGYGKYQTLADARGEGKIGIPSRAHSHLLQIASTMGLFGLLFYLAFVIGFLLVVYRLAKVVERERERLVYAGLGAGAIAYLLFLLTGISTVEVTPIWWILVGAVVAQPSLSRVVSVRNRPYPIWLKAFIIVVLVLGVGLAVLFSAELYQARVYYQASRSVPSGKGALERATRYAGKACQTFSFDDVYWGWLGELHLELAERTRSKNQLQEAVSSLQRAISISPMDARYRVSLAEAYTLGGTLYKSKKAYYLDKAVEEGEKATEARPRWPVTWYVLAFAYLKRGQPKIAIRYLRFAVKIDSEYLPAYFTLAYSYELMGDYKSAFDSYKKALELDPHNKKIKRAIRYLKDKYSLE